MSTANPRVSTPPVSRASLSEPRPPEHVPSAKTRDEPGVVCDDRRHHARATFGMPVHVVTPAGVVHCVADNLSAGGALLSGAPALEPGTELVVALRLRGHPWHVRARVMRVQRDASGQISVAVSFPALVPKVQDLIQNYVLSRLRHAGRSS